jgi:hypothetical protein
MRPLSATSTDVASFAGSIKDHECVLVHCERGFRRVKLPPLEPDGPTAKWYSRWRG